MTTMETVQKQPIEAASPRSVANKSDRQRLLEAIRMTLRIESPAVRRNTQTFNRNRYRATRLLPDYNALKERARQIKERSIASLPQLIEQLQKTVRERGGGRVPVCVRCLRAPWRKAGRQGEKHHNGRNSIESRARSRGNGGCRERPCGVYSAGCR